MFQTCRASCEKESAISVPQYAVSQWLGHSIEVSGRHDTNGVPDEPFDRVTKQAAQNAAQHLHETPRTAVNSSGSRAAASAVRNASLQMLGRSGFEISLKGKSFASIRKMNGDDQFPRCKLGRVFGAAGVVSGQSLFQICC
jgi:hypothetical protein